MSERAAIAFTTRQRIHVGDARCMDAIADDTVHLVVTSPPYPMIEMWDEALCAQSPDAAARLAAGDGPAAFEAMHSDVLDPVWRECLRVLVPGGFACVNVGDATRTIAGCFRLYPNHARILQAAMALGFEVLPDILWRKPTNAPNKFMGSGMLPAGAYVTYEHEYILVLRKPGRRAFALQDGERRAQSAFFWEERNEWFSDVWSGLPGTRQRRGGNDARARSAAFPLEVPLRLLRMYALYEDTVLDPFAGTGTTLAAAALAGRHGIGYEVAPAYVEAAATTIEEAVALGATHAQARLAAHDAFVRERVARGKVLKHRHAACGFPVVTKQERHLRIAAPVALRWRERPVDGADEGIAAEVDLAWVEPGEAMVLSEGEVEGELDREARGVKVERG